MRITSPSLPNTVVSSDAGASALDGPSFDSIMVKIGAVSGARLKRTDMVGAKVRIPILEAKRQANAVLLPGPASSKLHGV